MTVPEEAFDRLAAGYDRTFSESGLGRRLRERTWSALAAAFEEGSRVVDLGCGTGEDALFLARRGVEVLAVDASAQMLSQARAKVASAGLGERVRLMQADLRDASELERVFGAGVTFDGAYSNFGALNCLPDRAALAEALGGCVRCGGRLLLVLMGPWCVLEVLAHVARGRLGAASRRLRGGVEVRLAGGPVSRVWYPSPRRLRRELLPWFCRASLEGLGVVLPPTYLGPRLERRKGLLEALDRWDRRLGRIFPGRYLGDHYLARFERR